MEFAFEHANGHFIKCPFSKCYLKKFQTRYVIHEHLNVEIFVKTTKFGIFTMKDQVQVSLSAHVIEDFIESQNPMEHMLNDAFGFIRHDVNDFDEEDDLQNNEWCDEGITNFDVL